MVDNERKIIEVDQFILGLPEDTQNIAKTLREIILDSSPVLVEEYKWSMPNYSYKGLVCYLQTAKKHVNLGFQKGNELVDKDINNLLQGSGKNMRHIKITKIEEIQSEAFRSLIQAAIALNEGENND
ncbi:hypothetical protein SAMN05518871_11122 [Psychrobacillus sp. OK028]|uniref:DUF1801 domain-containing protein n=1 Tax=Psychrobacillus sp. OK028 TaxID=1884359 RepID=UPI0008911EF0|nr:DUF1801 domain-containing protein [Psychrobacillus sp. OK028]SDO14972.1 hypothetical protein SAMN05518871_11122 [Psychrobacillus sp. OK028]